MTKHLSHDTYISLDASSYDEIETCRNCGATDAVGGWRGLTNPCPKSGKNLVPKIEHITYSSVDVRNLLRYLVTNPRERDVMLALADALLEGGEEDLAKAYRWATENGKWPWEKQYDTHGRKERKILDWDTYRSGFLGALSYEIPDSAKLPVELYQSIVRLPRYEKKYGGVHRAFLLLAKGLRKLGERKSGTAEEATT